VNFDGTSTPAIRASGNVSSITDNGTGDYRVNFTNAMPDVNYCPVANAVDGFRVIGVSDRAADMLTTSVRFLNRIPSNAAVVDSDGVFAAIFR
jgi:hypothetical protein